MELRDRDGELITCKTEKGFYPSICLICLMTIIIHCAECGKQVTGCKCTAKARQQLITPEDLHG